MLDCIRTNGMIRFLSDCQTRSDLVSLGKLALPIALAYLTQYLVTIATTESVKALGVAEQAGVTLGIMFCNSTGFAIIYGLASAADTLFSQAYGYDPHSPLLSVYFQRSVFMSMIFCIPVGIMWLCSKSILRFFGQSEEVVQYASSLIHIYIFALAPAVLLELVRKLAQLYDLIFHIAILCSVALACGIFVYAPVVNAMGISGAVLLNSILYSTYLILACCVIYFHGLVPKLWHGFSRAAVQDLGQFLQLGIPCMMMMVIEWSAYEALGFLSGYLGVEELDCIAITMQMLSIAFLFQWGLSSAISIRVGSHLGGGNHEGARRCALTGILLSLTLIFISDLLLLTVGKSVIRSYTLDERVVSMTISLLPTIAAFHCIDGLMAYCGGVIRGLGHQMFGFYVTLIQYTIGFPITYILSFHFEMREKGIWIGPLVGGTITVIIYVIWLNRIDWLRAAKEANVRLEHGMEVMRSVGESVGRLVEHPLDNGTRTDIDKGDCTALKVDISAQEENDNDEEEEENVTSPTFILAHHINNTVLGSDQEEMNELKSFNTQNAEVENCNAA